MSKLKCVCVFCGSSPGHDPAYAQAARAMGRVLAARGITLVYGGGRVGMMGAIAQAALDAGGKVIGVIPEALKRKELASDDLTQLHIVQTMHERKQLMADLADAFIAMPGGFGTFEEFCEILTWAQLGLHAKPIGLLDVHGYFAPLVAMVDRAVAERFVRPEHRALLLHGIAAETLLDAMAAWWPPSAPAKWIGRDDT